MYFYYEDKSLYYEKYGNNNKSIVILPGWGETRKTFDYMINFLKNYFTVYIVDYPGFGNSPLSKSSLTIYDYSLLIHEWIKELNLDNPILIGHSFGGRIIAVMLGYYKYKYNNIILINSAGIKPKKKIKTYIYKALKLIAKILPKKIKNKYLKYLFSIFASSDYKDLNPSIRETFKNIVNEDLKPYFKNIKAKALLIWGNLDTSTPVSDAYLINKLITNSELIILDKVGHFSYLERPDLVNRIILEQLK